MTMMSVTLAQILMDQVARLRQSWKGEKAAAMACITTRDERRVSFLSGGDCVLLVDVTLDVVIKKSS